MSVKNLVEAFAAGWREPHPHAWDDILAEDVELIQPLLPPMRGRAALQREYGRLLELVPDLTGEIRQWTCAREEDATRVVIEMRLSGSVAGTSIHLDLVDSCLVRDGRIVSRRAYFDPLPLIGHLATHPTTWPAWWRSGIGPRRRPPERGDRARRIAHALAWGRLALGVAAWIAPAASARVAGLAADPDRNVSYLLRVFGARAAALGLSTLLAPDVTHLRMSQRLGLVVDIADTIAAPLSGLPARPRALSMLTTAAYAVAGVVALRDLRPGGR